MILVILRGQDISSNLVDLYLEACRRAASPVSERYPNPTQFSATAFKSLDYICLSYEYGEDIHE